MSHPSEDEVAVRTAAVDPLPSGVTQTRRFAGTWSLIWSPEARRWLLDRADIAAVA